MIDYEKINYQDISSPKSGYTVYVNKYWLCDGSPERALFYGKGPQCNNDEEIMKRAGLGRFFPELKNKLGINPEIIFMPVSYVGVHRD